MGRSDKDYQKLRVERAGMPDEEDDPEAPPAQTAEPGSADQAPPATSAQ